MIFFTVYMDPIGPKVLENYIFLLVLMDQTCQNVQLKGAPLGEKKVKN